MTINLTDISPVQLDGTILSGPALDLLHGRESLVGDDDCLFNELYQLESAEVIVPDLSVGGTTHEMHVWQVLSGGLLSKWGRASSGGGSVSGSQSDLDAEVVVVAVPTGITVPEAPAPAGPPAPGTTQKKVRVKIKRQGSLPGD